MARPKNKRTKKRTAPFNKPAAASAESTVSAVSEAQPAAKSEAAAETKPVEKRKAAAKPQKSETAAKENTFLFQSSGREYTANDIAELCKAAYRNGTRKQVRSCNVYLKSENDGLRAYYVINGNSDGAYIDL